jgi:hypothetical protein
VVQAQKSGMQMVKDIKKMLKDAKGQKGQPFGRDEDQLKFRENIGQLKQAMPNFDTETFKAVIEEFLVDFEKGRVNDLFETLQLLPAEGSAICDCLEVINFLSKHCDTWMKLSARSQLNANFHRGDKEQLFQQLFLVVAKCFFGRTNWNTERSSQLMECMSLCLINIREYCTVILLEDPFSKYLEAISDNIGLIDNINDPDGSPECAARNKVVKWAALNIAAEFKEDYVNIKKCVRNNLTREKGVRALLQLSQLLRNIAERFIDEFEVDDDTGLTLIDLDLNFMGSALFDVLYTHATSIRKSETKYTPEQALQILLEVETERQHMIDIIKEIKHVREISDSRDTFEGSRGK